MPVFMRILADAPFLADEFLSELLDAARLISDPAAIEQIRPLLKHRAATVRAKSILFLTELADSISAAEIEQLRETDTSVEVQRALLRIETFGKAV